MQCGRCKHEFCWLCMGDHYSYSHKPGMAKYCGQASSAKAMLYGLIVVVTIIKLLSLFISNFDPDSWSLPELFTLITPLNILYYGGVGLCANACVVAFVFTTTIGRNACIVAAILAAIGFVYLEMVGVGV